MKALQNKGFFQHLRSPSTLYVLSPRNVSVVSWNKKTKKPQIPSPQWETPEPQQSTPCSLQLVKSLSSTEDPEESKIIKWFFQIIMIKKKIHKQKLQTKPQLRVGQVCACSLKVTDNLSLVFSVTFKEQILQVQFSSVAQSCPTLWDPKDYSTPGLPNHHQLPEFTQTHVHWVSDAIQPSHPLSSLSPPAFNPSQHRVFSNKSVLHIRWPKYWSFSFNNSPSNDYSGLISFRMDWLDLLAVQGTLESLLQHHSSKASIFQDSAFFTVQLSHPHMTTGKTIALTTWNFVGKVMSPLCDKPCRLVITYLPRSKSLLISWFQSPSAVILESPKIKSDTVSPSISHEVMGLDAMILVFWMLSFKPIFSLSSFPFIKRLFSSSSLSAIRAVSSAYLRLLIFPHALLIPACASSSPVFAWCTLHII